MTKYNCGLFLSLRKMFLQIQKKFVSLHFIFNNLKKMQTMSEKRKKISIGSLMIFITEAILSA